MTNHDRLSIRPGEIAEIELPYSEVCMHMRIAGNTMRVQLVKSNTTPSYYFARILRDDDTDYCAPINYGEAGIFRDSAGFYHY